jgi:hypothetical protein
LPGQLVGAALAVLIIWANIASESRSLYSFQFIELDPFLTGLFTGFISQIIYLLYFFFIVHIKSISQFFRLVLFSIGLGIVFFIVTQLGKITLLNPFGFLFSSILNGHPESIQTVLIGVVIHIIVPMFFISGTHFFVKGIIVRRNT